MVSVRDRQRARDVRRMEEASVAGESPDRSKQRESSEEPTSGSAGPVPEARTEAGEPRDPRLTVAREDAKPSASAGSAGSGASRGGVDTATRVLSVREAEDDGAEDAAEDEADAEAGKAGKAADAGDAGDAGPESTGEDEPAKDKPAEASGTDRAEPAEAAEPAASSDGRLRDVVAAWVATAEERAAANARDDEDAEGPADAAKPAEDAEDTTTDAEDAQGTPEDTASDAEDTPKDAQDTPVDAEDSQDADAAKDTPKDADDDSDGGDAPEAVTAADDGTDSPADEDDDQGGDRSGDADDGGRRVDQPTAVFKAPRPSEPAVDQPTTMLKLGDATTPEKTGKGAETDAERTSKFVALRHPDDPATRKPPQPAKPPMAPDEDPKAASRAPRAPRTGVTAAVPQVGPERTTQQPLPPKPPLDLLAELTNTPPPPETPLRTTVRRVKIWTPLVILLLIVLGVVQSMRPLPEPTLDLTARESFTFEGGKPQIPWPSSGQAALDVQGIGTFGSSGEQKPVPIASVAKVMTAYVVLRDHPLESGAEGPMIGIDRAAEEQSDAGQESTVHVYEGDKISQREALEAILIASANNVARLLARWDAGSEKAFVEKMNAAAKDLGMTNTTYTDPSGLDNTTVSTAVDQVKLAKEAMKSAAFREVAAQMSYDDYKGRNHSNWNHLVGSNGVVGIKTGTTSSALGNLVFAAKKEVGGETRTIVGAVVRQPAGGKDNTILGAALDSSDQLIRAAQDTLESSTILKKGSVVGYVDDGLGGRTPVVATKDVKAVGWPGLTVKLTFEADEVPHTAAAGTKVGTLTVGDGGAAGAVKVPVALQDDLVEPAFTDKLTRLG
ncbi:D-alanyl-D-alanine carboxypeptidase [Streptomyces sp. BK79]|uniref:D-alanyl-D-alanine carboxypeptidase n=1 Tax=Streptomyces sp. BK79 TaxID=3350097 RepID=UPI0037700892